MSVARCELHTICPRHEISRAAKSIHSWSFEQCCVGVSRHNGLRDWAWSAQSQGVPRANSEHIRLCCVQVVHPDFGGSGFCNRGFPGEDGRAGFSNFDDIIRVPARSVAMVGWSLKTLFFAFWRPKFFLIFCLLKATTGISAGSYTNN